MKSKSLVAARLRSQSYPRLLGPQGPAIHGETRPRSGCRKIWTGYFLKLAPFRPDPQDTTFGSMSTGAPPSSTRR